MVTVAQTEKELAEYTNLLKSITALDGELEQRRTDILEPVAAEIESLNQRIESLKGNYSFEIDMLTEQIAERRSALVEQAEVLKHAVEDSVKEVGVTVKVAEMMAVYTPSKIDWDGKQLEGFAKAHPEVLGCSRTTEPKVVIRRR